MHKPAKSGMGFLRLSAISVALIAATLLCALSYQRNATRYIQEKAFTTLSDSVSEQATLFDVTLDGQFDVLESFSAILAQDDSHSSQTIARYLSEIASVTDYSDIFYASASGSVYTETGIAPSVKGEEYFISAMSGKREISISSGSSGRRFNIAVPVIRGGTVEAVLVGVLDEATFREQLISHVYSGTGFSFVCAPDGSIIIGEPTGEFTAGDSFLARLEDSGLSGDTVEDLRDALSNGGSGSVRYSHDGKSRYAVFAPLERHGWEMVVCVPYSVISNEISRTVRSGYLITLALFLIAVTFAALVFVLSKRQSDALAREKAELEFSDQRLRVALENTTVTTWDCDIKSRCLLQTDASIARHGMGKVVCDVPRSLVESGYVHPDYAASFVRMYEELFSGVEKTEGVFRVRRSDGNGYWYEHIRYVNMFDKNGKPHRAVGVSDDVTEKYETMLAYKRELTYRAAVGADICSWAVLNVTKRIPIEVYADDEHEQTLLNGIDFAGYFRLAAELVVDDEEARSYFLQTTPEQIETGFVNGITSHSLEYTRASSAARQMWVSYESHLLTDPDSGDLMIFIYYKDVDAEHRRMDELAKAAERDSMTGLLNHEATLAQIEQYLSADGKSGCHALYMVDMDNFKAVNDTFGHQSGDTVIEKTAHIIGGLFRASDIVGRVGGDEFMILMKNAADMNMIRKRAVELIQSLSYNYAVDDIALELSASVGVSVYSAGKSAAQLYSEADKALYAAKQAGKRQFMVSGGDSQWQQKNT